MTDLSLDDVRQIYEFGMEMEGFAVQLSRESGRPNKEDVRQLEHALAEMDAGARHTLAIADLGFLAEPKEV